MATRQRRAEPGRIEHITRAILLLRGQRVLLDAELAKLYDVTTKALNQAVKRNADRFPRDFLFRLNRVETDALNRSQAVTGSQKHRDPRFPPFAVIDHNVQEAHGIGKVVRQEVTSAFVQKAIDREACYHPSFNCGETCTR